LAKKLLYNGGNIFNDLILAEQEYVALLMRHDKDKKAAKLPSTTRNPYLLIDVFPGILSQVTPEFATQFAREYPIHPVSLNQHAPKRWVSFSSRCADELESAMARSKA
jgi:hypothetical protein